MAASKPVKNIDIDDELAELTPMEVAAVKDLDDADELGAVWFHAGNGLDYHVVVGSPAWERLVDDGAVRVDAPKK